MSQATANSSKKVWDDLGLENEYIGFSCPLESFNELLAQTIASEYARSVLGVFVERFAHVFSKSDLDDLFSRLLQADLPFELAWSSDLGNLYRVSRRGDEDHAMRNAAAFALMAGAKGFGGEWQLELSKATKFFWADWALPDCDKLTVISSDANASIKLSLDGDQTQVLFERGLDGWDCQTPARAVRLPSFGTGKHRLVLLPRYAALDCGIVHGVDDAALVLETFSPALIEILTQALDVLEEHLPHYFDWVVRIIRRVAVVHFERNVLYSGSHEHQYGTIHISDNFRVLSLAEMLIHEASHQYLELLNKLGPTVDPGHTELYYSPVKKCDRPLHKILLAYHAFANVMLFYRGVAECGLADSCFAKFQNVLNDELRQLEQPLLENDAILPIGRALVEPLIERSVCQVTAPGPKKGSEEGRIGSLVVKVAERCNLNCSYCYMYNHADQSYLRRPAFMSDEVFAQLLVRINEYCDRRPKHRMSLVFHGGEPMLMGTERFRRFTNRAREKLGKKLHSIKLQSNATLVDDDWIAALHELGVSVGVSIDGPSEIHDMFRVDHAGKGSHALVLKGLQRLQEHGLLSGVICVVNPAHSGFEVYCYFRSLGITRMNFLFPDATHDVKQKLYGQYGKTPVADYLIPIFDEWVNEDDPAVKVTCFEDIIRAILGGKPRSDLIGNSRANYLVIDTDGSIQALDALKVCWEGTPESGLNLFEHGFDDLHKGLPLLHRVVHEGIPMCATCDACRERGTCSGGYLPHRYSRINGFDNPSIWCQDLLTLFAHVRNYIDTKAGA